MNIAFFLTPKSDVIYEFSNSTMRQALERMEYHRYSSIPIIDEDGRYVGTLTEGDLLWKLKSDMKLNFKEASSVLISDIPNHVMNKPVSIDSNIEDLISLAATQNFVPVVDDEGIFIGIIKRSDIINYCYKRLFEEKNNKDK